MLAVGRQYAKDFAQQRFALQLCRLAAAPRHDGCFFCPSLKCRDTLAKNPVFGSGELWKSWAKSPTTMGIQPTIIKSNGFNWQKTTISFSSQLHNLDGLQRPQQFHLTYGEIHGGSGSYPLKWPERSARFGWGTGRFLGPAPVDLVAI